MFARFLAEQGNIEDVDDVLMDAIEIDPSTVKCVSNANVHFVRRVPSKFVRHGSPCRSVP